MVYCFEVAFPRNLSGDPAVSSSSMAEDTFVCVYNMSFSSMLMYCWLLLYEGFGSLPSQRVNVISFECDYICVFQLSDLRF